GAGRNCNAPFTSQGSNLSDDGTCTSFLTKPGDQNNVGNLSLGVLRDNGGSTWTHALLAGSAAIDAVQGSCTVDGTAGGTAVSTDQRGTARPQDGDGNGSAVCDAGAYERAPGTVQFSSASYSVSEASPFVEIAVTRTGGADGAVGATVTMTNGTATAPLDYSNAPIVVSFPDGDGTDKTVNVPIVDDSLNEANETFTATLGSPTGGIG